MAVFADAVYALTTTAVYRDPSAWMHVLFAVDLTAASNRVRIYVNGQEQGATRTVPGQGYGSSSFNAAGSLHAVGARARQNAISGNYFDGYLTDVYFVEYRARWFGFWSNAKRFARGGPHRVHQVIRIQLRTYIPDLPMRVDLVDWYDLSDEFRQAIARDLVPISAGMLNEEPAEEATAL